MTNANAHRQHRNQRLRQEVRAIVEGLEDGAILETSAIAAMLGRGKLEPATRSIGRMIAELRPEMVVSAGTGHWVRRVRVVEA